MPYGKIINNLISIYVTSALIEGVPFGQKLIDQISESRDPNYSIKMIFLAILIVGIFIVVSWGVALRGDHRQHRTRWLSDWWKVVAVGFAQAGLLASIALRYLDVLLASQISWTIRSLFIGEIAKVIWFLLPIVVLIIVSKLSNDEEGGEHHTTSGKHH